LRALRQTPITSARVEAFRRALPDAHRISKSIDVSALLANAWQSARERYPTIDVDALTFFTYLGKRVREADLTGVLEHLHFADLYLACACAERDPAAAEVLERQLAPRIEQRLTRIGVGDDTRHDLLQELREKVLVPRGVAPWITGYNGRGSLASWLSVCAVRLARRRSRRYRRLIREDDVALADLGPGVPNPEVLYLKGQDARVFREVFVDAVAALSPRDRNLLRHYAFDGLSIDQIAAIYHIHRATAARQVRDARRILVEDTRERLRKRMGLDDSELRSFLRFILSWVDFALGQVLARPSLRGKPAPESRRKS
jgi:RNA polymerase sigma-70 factor (ECF subfamily)